jgi:DNA helicase-2/ATP-dependent DNA helicase PcrA
MNYRIKELDNVSIVSNSDAHSPEKIAREATIFNCDLNYNEIRNAIIQNDERLEGTIEFFPEEGKYHYDGHRACNVHLNPEETEKLDAICPKCGKRLTVGVLNRVYKLSTREAEKNKLNRKKFFSVIPLKEVLSEILNKGVQTKTVEQEHTKLLAMFGNELSIALETPITELEKHSPLLAKAIQKMRQGDINIVPGYDGVFGKTSIFKSGEKESISSENQMSLV